MQHIFKFLILLLYICIHLRNVGYFPCFTLPFYRLLICVGNNLAIFTIASGITISALVISCRSRKNY